MHDILARIFAASVSAQGTRRRKPTRVVVFLPPLLPLASEKCIIVPDSCTKEARDFEDFFRRREEEKERGVCW